ncbi:MAG: DUF5906 domain-containing protein [Bacteroidales bacterium]
MPNIEEYFKRRLASLRLTEESNKRMVYMDGIPQSVPIIFPSDKDDAIVIPYVDPEGERAQYMNGKKPQDFFRMRFRKPREFENKKGEKRVMKYSQPKESEIYSYLPPAIVEKYRKKEHIRTLYVIEGEFKAISGSLLGLDFVGIGGIFNFKDKKQNELDEYLKKIILNCHVRNIVILQDADCRHVKYEPKKDLAQRLQSFANAVAQFYEMLKPFDLDVYFGHIDDKFIDLAKGLDDLLALDGTDRDKVRDELEMFSTGNKQYFQCIPISGSINERLRKHFYLDSQSVFYERYKSIIQEKEFVYLGRRFYFDGQKVVNSMHQDALSYLRIGTTFYKKVYKINPHKQKKHQVPMLELIEWNIGEINRDYNNNKTFLAMIPKFDKFINVPCNTSDYRRIVEFEYEGIKNQYYNLYNPLNHYPVEGGWNNIEAFLRHIFGSKNTSGESLYEFGLDWIQLCFYKPTQKLPVLCPVSRERNTGKSTFLQFLKLIFKENAAILDNERFTGKFTAHFVDKLIVALDEGFIPMEQKLMKERIKNYSTGHTIWLEGKGTNAQEIDNHIHLIMCSNDEKNFMQIDEGENRFAVLKVHKLDSDNPNLLATMEEELPHFLHYLATRELRYETGKSRFSFHTSVYETDALKAVQARTIKPSWGAIKAFIRDQFEELNMSTLRYNTKELCAAVNENLKGRSIIERDVCDYLEDELGMRRSKKGRYKIFKKVCNTDSETGGEIISRPAEGRPFVLSIEDWFTPEELTEITCGEPLVKDDQCSIDYGK